MPPATSGDHMRRSLLETVGIAGSLLLLALVTLPYYAATRSTTWPWWIATRSLPLLALVWWMGQQIATRPRHVGRGISGWQWCLLAFAGVHVVAAAASPHVRASLDAALVIAGFVGFVLALVTWLQADEHRARQLGALAAAGGLVFAIVSLGLWITYGAGPAIARVRALNALAGADVFSLNPNGFRNDQPLGHSNYTAGVCILILPWLGWGCVAFRSRAGRIVAIIGALLVFAALLLSGSRGALLGLAGGVACAVIYAARAAQWTLRRVALTGAAGLLLVAVLVLAVPRVRNSVVDVWQGREANVGDRQRIAMMEVGFAMGAERWWIGQGPGLTPLLYPIYRHRVDGGTPSILQLHSTPIQWWADAGLPGLLLGAGLCAWACWAGFRRMERSGSARWEVAAAGVSLAGYAAFALTDYQMDLPVVLALLAVDLAVLLAALTGPAVAWSRWVAIGGAGVFLVGGVVLSIPEARARSGFAAAVTAFEHGGSSEAFDEAVVRAGALEPDSPYYLAGGAAAHLRLGFGTEDQTERRRHLAFARYFLEQVLVINPYSRFAHFNLGWLRLESDPAAAAEHFRRRLWLVPDRTGGYLGLGLALLESGDVERGRAALALELVNDPRFLTAPMWDTPALAPHREAVVQQACAIVDEFAASASGAEAAALARAARLLRWWQGGETLPAPWDHGVPSTVLAVGDVRPETPGWRVLAAAAARPEQRRALLERLVLVKRERPGTEAELTILEDLVTRLGTDWRAWLQAPEGRDAPFVKTFRPDRTAYAVLARNLDVPMPVDAYVVQRNEIAELFFSDVFPEAGWVNDARLLNYLTVHHL